MAVRRFAVGMTTVVAAAMLVLAPQASAQETTPAPQPAPPTSWTVAATPAPAPPLGSTAAPVPGSPTVRPAEPAPASTPTRVRPAEPAPVPPGQVSRIPEGGVATGGGDTAVDAGWAGGLLALGGLGLAGAVGAVGAVALRRRSTRG